MKVVANPQGNDLILCQITSQSVRDEYAIKIDDSDFITGGLAQSSNIRPNRLFTADQSIIIYKAGQIKPEKLEFVRMKIIEILEN